MRMPPGWRRFSSAPDAGETRNNHAMTKRRLRMADQQGPAESKPGRRNFLGFLGAAVGTGAAVAAVETIGSGVVAKAEAATAQPQTAPKPNIPGYDWGEHHWGYGVDATKCIG